MARSTHDPSVRDDRRRLSEIDEILAAGVASSSVDGVQVTYDLDSLRKERRRIEARLRVRRKPPIVRLGMGG